MATARALRERLAAGPILVAPGACDGMTARLVEQHGVEAVYMTGAGTAAALGYPDHGLVTLTEMADDAGRLAQAVSLPVVTDAGIAVRQAVGVARRVRPGRSR